MELLLKSPKQSKCDENIHNSPRSPSMLCVNTISNQSVSTSSLSISPISLVFNTPPASPVPSKMYSASWKKVSPKKKKKKKKKERKIEGTREYKKKDKNLHINEDENSPNEWHKRPGSKNPKYKTELCHRWTMYGTCKYGSHCAFAHGEEELRFCQPINNHTPRKQRTRKKRNLQLKRSESRGFMVFENTTSEEIENTIIQPKCIHLNTTSPDTSRYKFANNPLFIEKKKDIKDWTTDECTEWIISKKLPKYIGELFKEHVIDGSNIFMISKNDFRNMGIKIGHLVKLMKLIKELKIQDDIEIKSINTIKENQEYCEHKLIPFYSKSQIESQYLENNNLVSSLEN